MSSDPNEVTKTRANKRVVVACSAFVASMIGVSYAAVPLYQLFCQVTGYGGTTQRVEQMSDTVLDRTIKVRFDANVAGGLPWDFKPVQREVELRIGETVQVSYTAMNTSDVATTGQATFNVTPMAAGAYFNKIQCFCFTESELKPGETIDMPVVFFVDPAIVDDLDAKDISTITLSYTFFAHASEKPVAAVAEPVQDRNTL
ncbi:cytochrome c oxidase assembly protein [Hoeflea alexandrii]|uniref:Cytochrome c oxidase assembly protein CtaG n=1 Tax=Hoeflea alexandrii TaxID=288436 RepID=A0ABT1CTX8_9HYPH|nr:cytochrome c oxidase assembly protein [Hoeflea alexandrii]MCO6409618.1 cytochrome c oxidase assembly protein [Hoeflea alexandrii]MCY0152636.1 cytochrome c oxidase assembly protein [Hoeflea alexandrii]